MGQSLEDSCNTSAFVGSNGRFLLTTTQAVAIMIPTITITVLILFGNLLVVIAVLKERHLRTTQNIYFVSLALVDLMVAAFVLPLNIVNQYHGWQWPFGTALCKIYVTADITLCSMSIFHLCAIAEDRYRVVTQGAHYIQDKSVLDIVARILVIYILSFWIASPPLAGWDSTWLTTLDVDHDCKILDSAGYAVFSIFGSFYFPLAILTYFYWKIYRFITGRIRSKGLKRELEVEAPSDPNLTESGNVDQAIVQTLPRRRSSFQLKQFLAKKRKFSLARERRASKTLGVIMGAFIICWLPFSLMYLITPLCGPSCPTVSRCLVEFLTWLGYFNSALNPIIYTVYNAEFRQAFAKLLHL